MKADDMLLMAVKPWLPKIKKQAGERVKELFTKLIVDNEKQLKVDNGEDYVAIMAIKTPKGEVYLLICAMSNDDKIVRTISMTKADEFTNQLMEDLL